jgi:hypothetical protein
MTAVPASDPYLLPLPSPASPVVLPQRAGTMHAHLNGRYSDPFWPLAPLTDNPSAERTTIHWRTWPTAFEDEMRLAAWNLINGQLRPTFLQEHSARMRGRLSMQQVYSTAVQWRRLAQWLEERGILSLSGCTATVLHEYGLQLLASGHTRTHDQKILSSISRLWALDQLSACPNGIGKPPWEDLGIDDYLPAAAGSGGENTTDPIHEQTMGPLLIWAMRLVDDLAADILAAWAERQRIITAARTTSPSPAGKTSLESYLRSLSDGQAPVPTIVNTGTLRYARSYISGVTGASLRQVDLAAERWGLAALAEQRPGPCPLDIPVTGRIAGKPWRTALDLNEATPLMRHLGTAAFIVCAYLTGMRPQEVLGLRTGCCPDPAPGPDGRPGRHFIRSHEFKTAADEDGNHQSSGIERAVPWVAITPVVNAVRVLECMVPEGHLLFDHCAHDMLTPRAGTGSLRLGTLGRRIEDFVSWANQEAERHGLKGESIPGDPGGSIVGSQFRRTLAWHIARRPGGRAALAVQYGHMRTNFEWSTDGYASRSRDGIYDLIDLETARAVADTVLDTHGSLENGGGISGPAARHVIRAAASAPRFVGTPITLASARKLLKNEDAMIFDNPHALVLCHYKRERALCNRGVAKDSPSLDQCVTGCGNRARTDQQAALLRDRAALLESQAAHVPGPIGDRMRATAARHREQADEHDRTRITTDGDTR